MNTFSSLCSPTVQGGAERRNTWKETHKYRKKDYLKVSPSAELLSFSLLSSGWSFSVKRGWKKWKKWKADLHSVAQGINRPSKVRHRRAEQEQSEAPLLQDSPGAEHLGEKSLWRDKDMNIPEQISLRLSKLWQAASWESFSLRWKWLTLLHFTLCRRDQAATETSPACLTANSKLNHNKAEMKQTKTTGRSEEEEDEVTGNLLSHSSVCPTRKKIRWPRENEFTYVPSQSFQSDFPARRRKVSGENPGDDTLGNRKKKIPTSQNTSRSSSVGFYVPQFQNSCESEKSSCSSSSRPGVLWSEGQRWVLEWWRGRQRRDELRLHCCCCCGCCRSLWWERLLHAAWVPEQVRGEGKGRTY